MANPNNLDLTEDRLFFLKVGVVSCAVCAPKAWTADEVASAVNREAPTGIASDWAPADPEPAPGSVFDNTNNAPCPDDANRLHWLLNC